MIVNLPFILESDEENLSGVLRYFMVRCKSQPIMAGFHRRPTASSKK